MGLNPLFEVIANKFEKMDNLTGKLTASDKDREDKEASVEKSRIQALILKALVQEKLTAFVKRLEVVINHEELTANLSRVGYAYKSAIRW